MSNELIEYADDLILVIRFLYRYLEADRWSWKQIITRRHITTAVKVLGLQYGRDGKSRLVYECRISNRLKERLALVGLDWRTWKVADQFRWDCACQQFVTGKFSLRVHHRLLATKQVPPAGTAYRYTLKRRKLRKGEEQASKSYVPHGTNDHVNPWAKAINAKLHKWA